ncbi:unnamed protein product, partial [Adineta steineri]
DSHSDINAAFGPRRSISSSPYSDHQLLSSLIEIKNDLSAEVRVLTRRMTHIDEQISQIFNILSPLHSSVVSNPEPAISNITQSSSPQPLLSRISSQSSPIRPSVLLLTTTTSSATNYTDAKSSPVFEAPSFYSDISAKTQFFDANQSSSSISDIQDVSLKSKTNDQSPTKQTSDTDSIV